MVFKGTAVATSSEQSLCALIALALSWVAQGYSGAHTMVTPLLAR